MPLELETKAVTDKIDVRSQEFEQWLKKNAEPGQDFVQGYLDKLAGVGEKQPEVQYSIGFPTKGTRPVVAAWKDNKVVASFFVELDDYRRFVGEIGDTSKFHDSQGLLQIGRGIMGRIRTIQNSDGTNENIVTFKYYDPIKKAPYELEISVSPGEGADIQATCPTAVEKTRYHVKKDAIKWNENQAKNIAEAVDVTIDVMKGANEPLVIVEVEFKNPAEKTTIDDVPVVSDILVEPSLFQTKIANVVIEKLKPVAGRQWSNDNLASKPYSTWSDIEKSMGGSGGKKVA